MKPYGCKYMCNFSVSQVFFEKNYKSEVINENVYNVAGC
jgi:hypothetical protein